MSILIGVVLLGVDVMVDQPQLGALIGWLGFINLLLGIFNLIPGFPMDGGRVLRAILWRLRGDAEAATRHAALVGRVSRYLLIGFGVSWRSARSEHRSAACGWRLIGWFLSTAAEATMAQAGVERSLRGSACATPWTRPPAVSPNEPVADLVQDRLLRGEDRSFLVRHDDGGLAGIVTLGDVRRLPRDAWAGARVTDIMTRFADLATIGPDAPLADALRLLQEREIGQLPVVGGDGRQPGRPGHASRDPAPPRGPHEARHVTPMLTVGRGAGAAAGARVEPTPGETVALTDAAGRVLAEPRVVAAVDVPPSTTRRWTGMRCVPPTRPGRCAVVGEVTAGMSSLPTVGAGTAVRIMTGAPMPPGADAVVPSRSAEESAARWARARHGRSPRSHRRPRHAGRRRDLPVRRAHPVEDRGAGVGRARLGRRAAAAGGCRSSRPATSWSGWGRRSGRTRSTTRTAWRSPRAVREAGGEALLLPRAPDDAGELERAMVDAASRADLVVTSAGVSVGRARPCPRGPRGPGSLDFWRIAIQPGKPLAVGELDGTTVIGLPGNPVSALVVFELFVRPLIRAMLGLPGDGRLHLRRCRRGASRRMPVARAFLRVRVLRDAGRRRSPAPPAVSSRPSCGRWPTPMPSSSSPRARTPPSPAHYEAICSSRSRLAAR